MRKFITLILLGFIIVGCNDMVESNSETDNKDEWKLEKQVTKVLDNLEFIFPSEGYAYDNREMFVQESIDAIKENCSIIKIPIYSEHIEIRFLDTREEMKKYTGVGASGLSNFYTKRVYIVANIKGEKIVKPPIKHELMHQISMASWGQPHKNSAWMNEGLAAFAENNCNSYSVGQIYRYLLAKDMFLPMDSLTSNFYGQDDMIAYHQSAYMVEYLINSYGIEKFRALWKQEFLAFEEIYKIPFSEMKLNINEKVLKDYQSTPNIDWEVFKEGCK